MSEHTLYRFWSGDELLYIGISINAYKRASDHRRDATWGSEADRVTFERYPSRPAVMAAEAHAIHREAPKYNVMHNYPTVENGPQDGLKRYLNSKETAAYMGIPLQTLYRWRSDGVDTPRAFHVGSLLRWSKATVDDWIAAQELKVSA